MIALVLVAAYSFMAGALAHQILSEGKEWGAIQKCAFVVFWPAVAVLCAGAWVFDRVAK